jgi:ABC-type amino acid transport substrate-binding protein
LFRIALFLAVAVLHGGPAPAKERYEVYVEDAAAPWSKPDGTGFANDVVKAAFAAAGAEVHLTVVPYARCKDAVVTGQVPVCFNMSWLDTFSHTVVFSAKPLFSFAADYFCRAEDPPVAQRLEDLKPGTAVATVHGYEYPSSVYVLKGQGLIKLEECRSEEQALKKLVARRVDLALVCWNELKAWPALARRAGVEGQIALRYSAGRLPSYVGFSLGMPEGLRAKAAFDRGYAAIEADGRLRAIEARWRRERQ